MSRPDAEHVSFLLALALVDATLAHCAACPAERSHAQAYFTTGKILERFRENPNDRERQAAADAIEAVIRYRQDFDTTTREQAA